MRTVTYGAACSLDGLIAAADGALDWLHFSPDVHDLMRAYWKTVDAVLMGRKTWEVAVAQGRGGTGSGPSMPATYVFSRTLHDIREPGARLVSTDPGGFVRDLKRRPGKGICMMGGGELARSLFEAGVIERWC